MRTNEIMAAFLGVNLSVTAPKTGLPKPLKMAKNPTSSVARPASTPTSVPTGFAMEIAIRPARQPMK